MDEWNSQDINIFCDYEFETKSNDDGDNAESEVHTKKAPTDEISKRSCDASIDDGSKNFKEFKRAKSSGAAEENDDAVWSIEDDTFFYPLSMNNHAVAGANKSVIIIYNEHSVINFVIKKMINQKQTKTTRVRLNVPQDETIKDVQILEFNTLLLLQSGRVNYFSSAKSMHSFSWLDGIRCIGRTLQGFCVIRLTADQRLLLQVYEDAVNMGRRSSGILNHQYDITFDEQNIFNCQWEDEKFVIFAIEIDAENIEFVEKLITNSCSLKDQKEIFIFAVSGNVFVLVPDSSNDDEEYHIEMIFSYASNIEFIKVDHERKFCLIFLECGTIDIWYMSTIPNRLLHQFHHTGTAYVNFSYSDKRAAFFYTDESQVVELKFIYNPIGDKFFVQETYKAISGILACTWIETIEQLICLDCNNIFHQLSFEALQTTDDPNYDKSNPFAADVDFEKFNTLFELTAQRVKELTKNASVIRQLQNLPAEIYKDIDKEYLKQQLLAVDENRNYYAKQIKAQLKFSKRFPIAFEKDTICIYANWEESCKTDRLLANISLHISQNEVFQSVSLWRLHVHFGESIHIFSLPASILSSKIQLVVPLKRCTQAMLSNIQLHLYTCLSHGTTHVAMALPIRLIETSDTYKDLFVPYTSCTENIHSVINLNELLKRFKTQQGENKSLEFEYCLPKNIKFETIKEIFNSLLEDQVTNDKDEIVIGFLKHKICVTWTKEKDCIYLKSFDAGALYYFKLYVTLVCKEKNLPIALYELNDYQQMILRHQCSVERCYGSLDEFGVDNHDISSAPSSRNQRIEELKQIYEKIRKYVVSK